MKFKSEPQDAKVGNIQACCLGNHLFCVILGSSWLDQLCIYKLKLLSL